MGAIDNRSSRSCSRRHGGRRICTSSKAHNVSDDDEEESEVKTGVTDVVGCSQGERKGSEEEREKGWKIQGCKVIE